jgi:putative NADH-flavin reductase
MRIIVFGASGQTGRFLVQLALEKGHRVTAVYRSESGYTPPPGVTSRVGNVLTPEFVIDSIRDHDIVISALGLKRVSEKNPWSPLISPPDFVSRTAKSIVAGMRKYGVRRVMAISAVGVGDSYMKIPFWFKAILATSKVGTAYEDLTRMEEIYLNSGMDWLCVRAGKLEDKPTARAVSVEDLSKSMKISREELARYMLDQLDRPFFDVRTPIVVEKVD